jgi:hypothetical protein
MKRSLVERAKHTSFEKTAIETPSSPPHKAPRLEQTTSHQEEALPVDDTPAFYLKHQNRALATELKNLRHDVSCLEKERDARRAQCRAAVKALLRLQLQNGNNVALVASSGDPPSTGSGDSVEWTSALEKAVEGLLQTRTTNGDSSIPEQDTALANETAAGLRAEVMELQNQIAELVASRTELHQRERKVRRNVYRMSAGMISPEQVLNSLDKDDEMEATVRLEKAELITSSSAASRDRLKDQDAAAVDSVLAEELETKIATLEATIRRSEESIQKVRPFHRCIL